MLKLTRDIKYRPKNPFLIPKSHKKYSFSFEEKIHNNYDPPENAEKNAKKVA